MKDTITLMIACGTLVVHAIRLIVDIRKDKKK